ncbi:PTS fructose transporter subunit IIB [Celerinatantimonas sp. YJH-8]|uniref:PTS fructose transporter subunit IIB n=1 Tax=Celerinatantimonas sp. YJH-8 TaxID=3228714 RepID=UPI0038BF0B92
MFIVAVTACMSGVAHTYMSAEKIEKLCAARGIRIRVETQGALGTENKLTEDDIAKADVALLITDINVEGEERFTHCRQIRVSTNIFLREANRVMKTIEQISGLSPQTCIHIT